MIKIKKKSTWLSSIIFLLILIAASCSNVFNTDQYNKIKSVEASPSEALPIGFGELSISDILSNKDSANIKVYNDGLVYLEYDQTLRSVWLKLYCLKLIRFLLYIEQLHFEIRTI